MYKHTQTHIYMWICVKMNNKMQHNINVDHLC